VKRDPIVGDLLRLAPFANCSERDLRFVAQRCTELHTGAGALLAREGRPGYECGVIISGLATVHRGDLVITRLGPGDFFGEIALLDHGTRTATVVAETGVVAVVCAAAEFRQILERCPTVTRALLAELAGRLRTLTVEPPGRSAAVFP
jgi:CRP/FNR family cyclic AMP-dependent transcriptional regulator